MSLFIKQARELYISTFSTAILKKYSEEDINIQLEGSARIDEYYKSVFILLSKAVLSGEYIFDPNYRKALDAFEADIAMEIGNIDTYFTQRFSDLSLGLKCILKHYVGFLINIEDKIKNSDEEFFFSAFKSDDKNINNEFLSDFISIVLKLASIDHFLIADNDNREILVILREELENRKKVENKDLKDIYSALLDKCNLLLVKMFYDPIIGRNYSLNFKKHSVDEIEFSESSLKETFNRYNFMFNSSFDKGLYKEQITKYQEKCISRHSKASELILLMKHYQKDNCSSRQVKNLLQSFDALYKSIYATKIKRKFDIVALNSIKNYLYNCKLSINLENPEYTIENLKTDLLEINDIQNETRIYNYFPYYKALTFLSKRTENTFATKSNRDSIQELLLFFDELLEKFKHNLKWCYRNRYYPFQLISNECVVQYKDTDISLFIASSFCRPINYNRLNSKLQDLELKRKFYDSQNELSKERETIIQIQDRISKKENKTFEYMGIFMAIITFLFASIPVFSSKTLSTQEALWNIGILGTILIIFLLILKVFQLLSDRNIKWIAIVMLILMLLGIIGYAISKIS